MTEELSIVAQLKQHQQASKEEQDKPSWRVSAGMITQPGKLYEIHLSSNSSTGALLEWYPRVTQNEFHDLYLWVAHLIETRTGMDADAVMSPLSDNEGYQGKTEVPRFSQFDLDSGSVQFFSKPKPAPKEKDND